MSSYNTDRLLVLIWTCTLLGMMAACAWWGVASL